MPSAYDQMTITEIIYDYAVIRGDLTEAYARDQLAKIINERIEQARVDQSTGAVRVRDIYRRCRKLVSDWRRELGDPRSRRASVWLPAAKSWRFDQDDDE